MSVSPVSTVKFAKSPTAMLPILENTVDGSRKDKVSAEAMQWSDANETFNGHFDRIPPIMIQLYSFVLVFLFAIQFQNCGRRDCR